LFLAFDRFPWFRNASVADIFEVERPGLAHLYWPALDVDLTLACIRDPDQYPLVCTQTAPSS
jgi:hypothetical protein